MINPYTTYIKISTAALAWLWYEMSIRADLKAKTAEAALQKATAEIYAREFNNYQRYRASDLNLVVAAIVLWNTVYLEKDCASLA